MAPVHLLIPAAGSGRRMGADRNKILLPLLGQPIIAWTLQAAAQADSVSWIGLVGQEGDRADLETMVIALNLSKPVTFILGGDTRQQSVYNGLQALPEAATRVLIHDGARCLATPALFEQCDLPVQVVPGEETNLKVTTPMDLAIAEFILKQRLGSPEGSPGAVAA